MSVPFAYRRLGARDKSLTVAKTSYHEQVAPLPMKPHQEASRSGNLTMAEGPLGWTALPLSAGE